MWHSKHSDFRTDRDCDYERYEHHHHQEYHHHHEDSYDERCWDDDWRGSDCHGAEHGHYYGHDHHDQVIVIH